MTQQPATQQPDSVDRIRDIIFGTTMRDYDQRFEGVVRDLNRLQAELDRLNELLAAKDAAQTKSLQGVRQELRQAGNDLHTEMRNELDRLGAQLAEQGNAQNLLTQGLHDEVSKAGSALRDSLAAEAERLNTQLADEADARGAALQELRQELQQADRDLRDELRHVVQRLTETKTDRALLGDLFIELGNHVKTGSGLAELIKSLESTDRT